MKKKFWIMAALALLGATTANAGDRYGGYSSRNDFYISRSGRQIYQPSENRMWVGTRVNGGTYYQSGPITQYGSPQINYQFDRNGNVDLYGSGLIQPSRGLRPIW